MYKLNLGILLAAFLARVPAFSQGAPALDITDFSGVWAETIHEDSYERSGGPPLGDYQGIPLNDAGRMKADSHDHSEWSLPEFQCRPHSAPYQWRALGSVQVLERSRSDRTRSSGDSRRVSAFAGPRDLYGRPSAST